MLNSFHIKKGEQNKIKTVWKSLKMCSQLQWRTPTSIKKSNSQEKLLQQCALTVLTFFFLLWFFFAFKTLHTFSPPCRNRTLAKLQDAQNVTPTLHHWGNTSKLCTVLSFMHRKDIKENPISTTATAPIHMIPNPRTARLASSVVDTVIQVPIIKEWTRGPHIQHQSYCSLHQITKLP